jgi:hypothetical protein
MQTSTLILQTFEKWSFAPLSKLELKQYSHEIELNCMILFPFWVPPILPFTDYNRLF